MWKAMDEYLRCNLGRQIKNWVANRGKCLADGGSLGFEEGDFRIELIQTIAEIPQVWPKDREQVERSSRRLRLPWTPVGTMGWRPIWPAVAGSER
jgi:hypothetical protein